MKPGDKHTQSRRHREISSHRHLEEQQKPFSQVICSSHVVAQSITRKFIVLQSSIRAVF